MIADAHCHIFSSGFFRALGKAIVPEPAEAATELPARLGWDMPGSNAELADRWRHALDREGVSRAMLMASLPGDEDSVAEAVNVHPGRFVGAFMVNPAAPDAVERTERAFREKGLATACLFPAMHLLAVDDPRTIAIFDAARVARRALFVHCGVLSVGVRGKLDLPSQFDLRLGDPLAVAAVAVRYPEVPVIIPHFGAGLFREALMALKSTRNILLDTSSSNSWIALHPNLSLREVFARALDVAGPDRLLFGTDSSFFPRGWQRGVYEAQVNVMSELGLSDADRAAILGGNFDRVFAPRRP